MNILLIVLALILVWRVGAAMKKGIVRETLGLVTVIFAALVIGLASMIFDAYHEQNYIGIVLMIVGIAALSVLFSVIKIIFFPAKVLTKLPVISSMDKFLGFVMGFAETLIGYWALCYALMYIALGPLNEQLLIMIAESRILTFLYEYNVLGMLLEMLKAKIV